MPRLSPGLCLLLVPGLLAGGEPPKSLADRYGDPLPHGAIARMGTVRCRQAGLLAAAFSPDGKTLAVGGYDQAVHLIEAATGREVRALRGPNSWVSGVAFLSGGKVVVASSEDGNVRWWDAATGKELRCIKQSGRMHRLAATPDGKTLAWSDGRVIRLVDAATGKVLRSLTGHDKAVTALAFDGRGRLLASASVQDRRIVLWDAPTGKEVQRLETFLERDCPVALSPDGQILATWSWRGPVQLREPATGRVFRLLAAPDPDSIFTVAFSPDGGMVAVGGGSFTTTPGQNAIRVLETATGRERCRLLGHAGPVKALTVYPES